jgi:CheY-like chemotaxis protein
LAVVQGIVELHKGYISVETEVGTGTTFRIYTPAMETVQAQGTVEDLSVPPRGSETILLVEDEEIVRDMGKYALELFGYKVLAVTDGQEAVEVYGREKDSIALVILDIIMPRMDGKQCLKELLRLNPGVKVLISSGVVEDDVIQGMIHLGAKGSVMKPFHIKGLLEEVRKVLDGN